MGFPIHADHNGIVLRIQIESDNVRCFERKLGIGADAPGSAPLQLNSVSTKQSPDLVFRDISQRLGTSPPLQELPSSAVRLIGVVRSLM